MLTELKKTIYRKYLKRPLDIAFSAIALVCLSPLLLVVAILVRWKHGAPILFIQKRIGKDEKPFRMLKYRSMAIVRDAQGDLLPDADRLTPLGSFLRSSSIDELPALWNVLRGDMSLIGPRPLPLVYLPYFTQEERKRHTVRGGLSGLAQVNGRNALTWDERFKYDVEYVTGITFMGDMRIFLKTIAKVLGQSDIGLRGVEGPEDLDVCRIPQTSVQTEKKTTRGAGL